MDDFECEAEFIDGSYTYCGCPDCDQRAYEDRERDIELGCDPDLY
ncbi:hypothetical protein [Streptomyces sp. SBT349]|nr:hypothetical protein [Streptomyces sp. SBT349]